MILQHSTRFLSSDMLHTPGEEFVMAMIVNNSDDDDCDSDYDSHSAAA